jgi:hypothetical protein
MPTRLTCPDYFDFFKAQYYSNTYLPTVDLSDTGLLEHLLEGQVLLTAQELISHVDVKPILSDPLSYDFHGCVVQNNTILQEHGFTLLGCKPSNIKRERVPYYSVIEHNDLSNWIIKSGACRIPENLLTFGPANDRGEMSNFTAHDSLLRIAMAKRIQQVATEAGFNVVVPQKKLVRYNDSDSETDSNKKYCVVCSKIDILSAEDTVKTIIKMPLNSIKMIAREMSIIIQKAGLADASFNNIRLTPRGKLAFIDTEPCGLMVAKTPGLWNMFFDPKGASVEKCARVGLATLRAQLLQPGSALAKPGLESFYEIVNDSYIEAAIPQLSKYKIALSVVSLGLMVIVNVIIAFVKLTYAENALSQFYGMECNDKQTRPGRELHAEFRAWVEGVPTTLLA